MNPSNLDKNPFCLFSEAIITSLSETSSLISKVVNSIQISFFFHILTIQISKIRFCLTYSYQKGNIYKNHLPLRGYAGSINKTRT